MVALRAAFAVAITCLAAWLLSRGLPLVAVMTVVGGVMVRRSTESGRVGRFARRLAHPS
jgi:hypothetical protein